VGMRLAQRALRETVGEDRMPPVERLALVAMALHSLDSPGRNSADPPGVYWGGHTQLAREVYGDGNDSGIRQIRRVIRNLENRKLIRIYDANVGANRAYELFP